MSTDKYFLLTESKVITGTSQTETVVYRTNNNELFFKVISI